LLHIAFLSKINNYKSLIFLNFYQNGLYDFNYVEQTIPQRLRI
jgi:hypothetical protein